MRERGTVRLLLCEDSAQSRALLRRRMEETRDIEVVAECATGEQLAAQVAIKHPDVVLVDHLMDGPPFTDLLPKLRASSPRTAFLLYSGMPVEWLKEQAQKLQADGALHKSAGMREVRGLVLSSAPA
jgi:DNA-binding NarL/FixJ family response regulator